MASNIPHSGRPRGSVQHNATRLSYVDEKDNAAKHRAVLTKIRTKEQYKELKSYLQERLKRIDNTDTTEVAKTKDALDDLRDGDKTLQELLRIRANFM